MTVEIKDIPDLLLTDVFVGSQRVGWFDTNPGPKGHDVRDREGERVGFATDRQAAAAMLTGGAA